MIGKLRVLSAAASAGAVLLTACPAFAQSALQQVDPGQTETAENHASSIEGTWLFTLDRVNQGFSFTAVQSFTAGGVTIAIGSMLPPPALVLGPWRSLGRNQYAATVYFYLFDANGTATGIAKTKLSLRLDDENTLVGSGQGFGCDLNAENCVRVPVVDIQITGKRLRQKSDDN